MTSEQQAIETRYRIARAAAQAALAVVAKEAANMAWQTYLEDNNFPENVDKADWISTWFSNEQGDGPGPEWAWDIIADATQQAIEASKLCNCGKCIPIDSVAGATIEETYGEDENV
jgi:hypothetical protein